MTLSLYDISILLNLLRIRVTRHPVLATRYYLLSCPLHILKIDSLFRHLIKRRKFAQALHRLNDAVGHVVNFSFGVKTANAEANRTMRQIVACPECLQYIRWLKRRGGA